MGGGGDENYIKYARSKARIGEIFDELCESLDEKNAILTGKKTKRKSWTYLEPGKTGSISYEGTQMVKNPSQDGGEWAALQNNCDLFVEKHEDAITDLLYDNYDENLRYRTKICLKTADLCRHEAKKKEKKKEEKESKKRTLTSNTF